MSTETNFGNPNPTSQKPRPTPRCNLLSLISPMVGIIGAIIFFAIVGVDSFYSREMAWKGPTAMSILGSSCVVGLIFSLVAFARSERLRGLTVLGFLLNAPLPLTLVWAGLQQLENWLRYKS
jgi:hypothetical protein